MNIAVAFGAPIATIVVAVLGYFGVRKFRAAQTRKTDAETGKTEAEAWNILNGGLVTEVKRLTEENVRLRERVTQAEDAARDCNDRMDRIERWFADHNIDFTAEGLA